MCGIHVVLEEAVHVEGGRADRTLVGEMGRFECHLVVSAHVVQQLPLEHLRTHSTLICVVLKQCDILTGHSLLVGQLQQFG